MNPNCRSAPEGTPPAELGLLTSKIIALPLLDSHGRIVAAALPATDCLQLGSRRVGDGEPSFVIAEIGNNHNGDVGIALQLIDAAHAAAPTAPSSRCGT